MFIIARLESRRKLCNFLSQLSVMDWWCGSNMAVFDWPFDIVGFWDTMRHVSWRRFLSCVCYSEFKAVGVCAMALKSSNNEACIDEAVCIASVSFIYLWCALMFYGYNSCI